MQLSTHLPWPVQCNAEKKSLLQAEAGNDTELQRIVVRSLQPGPVARAARNTQTPSVQVAGSETTSQLPSSPKTAESGGGAPFAGPSKRLKLAILCAVTLQNAGYALVRRYSRGYLHEAYSASSALFVMEMAKLLLSAVVRLVRGRGRGRVRAGVRVRVRGTSQRPPTLRADRVPGGAWMGAGPGAEACAALLLTRLRPAPTLTLAITPTPTLPTLAITLTLTLTLAITPTPTLTPTLAITLTPTPTPTLALARTLTPTLTLALALALALTLTVPWAVRRHLGRSERRALRLAPLQGEASG